MKPVSVLIFCVLFAFCLSGGIRAETEETEQVTLFSYFMNAGINAFKSVTENVSEGVEKLTAKRYKDRRDICVWKICSRPLKKVKNTKKIDNELEIIGHMSPDGVYKYKVIKKGDPNTV